MDKFNTNNIEKESYFPNSCVELLKNFENKTSLSPGEKLNFSGVNGLDVYNISAPFQVGNKTFISGRVEERGDLAKSQVKFFEKNNDVWIPSKDTPTFPLEDGFITKIEGELIAGGVEVYPVYTKIDPKGIGYRTVFYRGQDLNSLKKFTTGPNKMKDIRLVSLQNNNIGVFTRPQEGINNEGKIGYLEIKSLEDLNVENILGAKIIENQFAPGEWGGANELHPLADGKIGVLGHIAYKDFKGDKHYYAMSFIYDTKTNTSSPVEIIATRKNFPEGAAKKPELSDIIFSGGLVRYEDGTATLYAGLSDAEAGRIEIPDPFINK
ncbi:MAG: DUF1861 family protein [Candidatus Pacebacteria bacterium]|nr:DUF1861 family protein [Candidatus Paceibacterota bacterium]